MLTLETLDESGCRPVRPMVTNKPGQAAVSTSLFGIWKSEGGSLYISSMAAVSSVSRSTIRSSADGSADAQ